MSRFNKDKLTSIFDSVSTSLSDLLLGPSATALVTKVASEVLIDLLQDKLGLSKEKQDDFRARATQASEHLSEAGAILSNLQNELTRRNSELDFLISEIDAKRTEAEHWQEIASTNENLARALTTEIEKRVKAQIREELDRDKTRRQVVGAIMWIITLIAGGIVGAAIQQWWQTGNVF